MKNPVITFIFSLAVVVLHAQQSVSPWETVAPPGSFVYTDLKSAIKDASVCYRLDLTGADFIKDKKTLPKATSLTNVMAFRLGNNNLTEIPTAFLQMHGLLYFRSSGNPLTTISDSMGMWSELRFLEFSGTNFDTLPRGIYGCSRLQSISIFSNTDTLKITNEISGIGKSLGELKIYSTHLDTLPDNFSSLTKLHKLVFYKCSLKEIPPQLLPMNQLQELWLDSNNISVVPKNISFLKGLTYLSLSGNHIQHIPSDICFLQSLAILDLKGNPIDPYEIHIVQALLPACRIIF